jgi:glycerol-3-phosphate O-acyltransferase
VQSELRNQSSEEGASSQPQKYKRLIYQSREFLQTLSSQINPRTIQVIFFTLHTVFKRCFDQIIVNDAELKQIKNLIEKEGQSVVLVPCFKSYMDAVLIQYIHIIYGVDLAFLSGNKEWADITVVSKLLRQCGSFFLESKKLEDPLYQILLEEFLAAIMRKRYIMGYQIERRR